MSIVIGIDPGAQTGIALIWDGVLRHMRTMAWEDGGLAIKSHLAILAETYESRKPSVVIEIPGPRFFRREGLSHAAQLKISRNVGECKAKAVELAAFCEGLGMKVRRREPIRGGTKRKVTGAMWRGLFKWEWRLPGSHARDAAMLARFG